jgi:hypothetical protein
MIAFIPEAQTLLIVVASVDSGMLYSQSVSNAAGPDATPDSPGTDGHLPSRGLTSTCLDDLTHVDLLDIFGFNTSLADGVLDSGDTELGSRYGAESTLE